MLTRQRLLLAWWSASLTGCILWLKVYGINCLWWLYLQYNKHIWFQFAYYWVMIMSAKRHGVLHEYRSYILVVLFGVYKFCIYVLDAAANKQIQCRYVICINATAETTADMPGYRPYYQCPTIPPPHAHMSCS